MEINDEYSENLVKIPRGIIEQYVSKGEAHQPSKYFARKFNKKLGVCVTINIRKGEDKVLRECVGFPQPVKPLMETLIDASIGSVAFDYRFHPVTEDELGIITVEVSVLTEPRLIHVSSPTEYQSQIKIGEDGRIVKWAKWSGLLLPQVPYQQGWDTQEFLSNACVKADLIPDFLLKTQTEIYKFQAKVYREVSPRGSVVRERFDNYNI